MFSEAKVTEIYCMADDFCKEFAKVQEKYMIKDRNHKYRNKPNRMSDTEIMVILILFHSGGFRCFKHYYKEYVCKHLPHLFPSRVSYNRFVLQGICLQASAPPLPQPCVLQPFCGTGERSPVATYRLHQGGLAGHLYRYQLCGFHTAACMPETTHIDP